MKYVSCGNKKEYKAELRSNFFTKKHIRRRKENLGRGIERVNKGTFKGDIIMQ